MMAFIRLNTEEAKEAPLALVCADPCTHSRDDISKIFISKIKSFNRIARDSIMNNWPALMTDVMKQHCSGIPD